MTYGLFCVMGHLYKFFGVALIYALLHFYYIELWKILIFLNLCELLTIELLTTHMLLTTYEYYYSHDIRAIFFNHHFSLFLR